MSEIEHEQAAVRAYEHVLAEVAEHQVIDAAEDVITRARVAELDQMRHEGLRLAMAVRIADRVAREELHQARIGGHAGELARAHARVVEAAAETRENLGHANSLLTSVDSELEAVCQAGLERARRGEADLGRLRDAWTAAYGQGGDEHGCEPGVGEGRG